jgi:hypothetical protein
MGAPPGVRCAALRWRGGGWPGQAGILGAGAGGVWGRAAPRCAAMAAAQRCRAPQRPAHRAGDHRP